ncbi:MAG: ABC transporter permease [Candidatus Izemoplasmatales bacterium]
MKKILWLIDKEWRVLYRTIFLFGITITLFCSTLFSFLSIKQDLFYNFISQIEEREDGITLGVDDIDFETISPYLSIDMSLVGSGRYYTEEAELIFNDKIFSTVSTQHLGDYTIISFYNGKIIPDPECQLLNEYNNSLFSGDWPMNYYEIALSQYIALQLGANIGDTITINHQDFLVVGIYDRTSQLFDSSEFAAYFYITLGPLDDIDTITIVTDSVYQGYQLSLNLSKLGYVVDVPSDIQVYFRNVSITDSFLLVTTIVIGVSIALCFYAVSSIIMIQREQYTKLLNILGFQEKTIMLGYFFIFVGMTLIASSIAFFMSMMIQDKIISLASDLFNMSFSSSIQLNNFLLITIVLLFISSLSFFISVKKVKR